MKFSPPNTCVMRLTNHHFYKLNKTAPGQNRTVTHGSGGHCPIRWATGASFATYAPCLIPGVEFPELNRNFHYIYKLRVTPASCALRHASCILRLLS